MNKTKMKGRAIDGGYVFMEDENLDIYLFS